MKSYQNPQPYAVDRVSTIKTENKSKTASNKINKTRFTTNEEIYKNEAEEQAWKDAIENSKKSPR